MTGQGAPLVVTVNSPFVDFYWNTSAFLTRAVIRNLYFLLAALVQSLQHHRNLFPNEDDFKGAQIALMRLQQTYDLPPATISDGIAPDVPSSTRMSADDTFAIGKEAYLKEDYVECELWMRETLRLLGIGRTQGKAPSRFEVLDYLAFAEQEVEYIYFVSIRHCV